MFVIILQEMGVPGAAKERKNGKVKKSNKKQSKNKYFDKKINKYFFLMWLLFIYNSIVRGEWKFESWMFPLETPKNASWVTRLFDFLTWSRRYGFV